ncbi:SWI/SNF chromatin-remodeling complex subunit SWI1 [Cyberlindnera fabianii]|uniref:SWI/SNF chromatin-remodeling complex subunit SWI1 n=1 Tax=Cyberlindnera fabianii TaxID=36022 RepID=A0A1V2LDK8_CYBFA|nr:SWI/SNF chromatin-remodeling complex subunit SWI1 [Cyberlindnera fabianii]
MGDNYWGDDGFNNSGNDDQVMSSFLNLMDDNDGAGTSNSNNINSGMPQNSGGSNSSGVGMGMGSNIQGNNSNGSSFDMGISPAAILNQQNQNQNQSQNQNQNQNQNQFQRQMPQHNSPMPQQTPLQRPSDTNDLIQSLLSDRNNGNNGAGNQMYQQQQQQQPPQNQGFPPNRQPSISASATPQIPNQPTPPMNMQTQGTPDGNMTPEQMQQRRLQQQQSAMQVELFMRTLTEFMNKRGTPLNSIPVVGGKKFHPFFLYALVARLGGSANVARQNQWGVVAQKLGLNTEQDTIRQLTKAYVDFLHPFEQYAGTPEGQRDLQARRQMLQKQQADLMKQRQPSQNQQSPDIAQPASTTVPTGTSLPTPVPTHASNIQPPPPPTQSIPPQPQVGQPQFAATRKSHGSIGGSPLTHSQAQNQIQRHTSGSRKSSEHASPLVVQQNIQSPAQPLQPPTKSQLPQAPLPQQPAPTPGIVKNYIPEQRLLDHHAGYDVKSLSQVGEQIDTAKPIFLFAPELGAINIHALTMSLESDSDSEVNTALNTILVASADNNLAIPLSECPEFLDSLATLGSRVLDHLLSGVDPREEVGFDEIDLENIDASAPTRVDEIFKKYVNEDEDYDEVEIKVDSFSGEPIQDEITQDSSTQQADIMEIDDQDNGNVSKSNTESSESLSPPLDVPEKFTVPSYSEMLAAVRSETEHPFSSIHTRTAEDRQVLLIDQLMTISMIFRNISFVEYNPNALAANDLFKDFLFKLVFAVAAHGEKFFFTRRRLGFLKDALIILMNISHLLELRSHNEALTILVLILSFGADEPDDKNLLIPEYIPTAHKYHSHGVDVLAKLIARDPPNKQFFQGVLTGTYDPSTPTELVDQNKKLVELYAGDDNSHMTLLTRVFRHLMSIIPLNSLALQPLLQERDAAILQSLLAAALIAEMIPTEVPEGNIALTWLSSAESIGNGLTRLALLLAAYSARPNENETLKLISIRALSVVNTLTQKALATVDFQDRSEDIKMFEKAKIQLPADAILGSLLSSIDVTIIDQIITLSGSLKRINQALIPSS